MRTARLHLTVAHAVIAQVSKSVVLYSRSHESPGLSDVQGLRQGDIVEWYLNQQAHGSRRVFALSSHLIFARVIYRRISTQWRLSWKSGAWYVHLAGVRKSRHPPVHTMYAQVRRVLQRMINVDNTLVRRKSAW